MFVGASLLQHTLRQSLDDDVGVGVGLLGVEGRSMALALVGGVSRVRGLAVSRRRCAHNAAIVGWVQRRRGGGWCMMLGRAGSEVQDEKSGRRNNGTGGLARWRSLSACLVDC